MSIQDFSELECNMYTKTCLSESRQHTSSMYALCMICRIPMLYPSIRFLERVLLNSVVETILHQGLAVIRQAESPSFTPGGLGQVLLIANRDSST